MRLSTILVINCLLFLVCTQGLYAQFGGGAGTAVDPWQISTAQHLNNIRDFIGTANADKHYIQTADIDLGIAPYNQGEGWDPIGGFISLEDWDAAFYGQYNGNHHTINNLYISRADVECQGLFGVVCGAISNLGVINADVLGGSAGAVTGCFAYATLYNCYSTGVVTGTNHHAGGIAGMGGYSTISSCYSNAFVTSGWNGGGLFGDGVDNTVSNCYSTGNVSGSEEQTGGFTGWASTSTFTNCYSTGHVSGDISGNIGGFVGYNDDSNFNACYWNTQTSGQSSSPGGFGRTTDDMTYPYGSNTFVGWDFSGIWAGDDTGTINNAYPYLRNCTSVAIDDDYVPYIDFELLFNYPNPFNPSTTIAFSIPQPGNVKLCVYNIKGQKVKEVLNTDMEKGFHKIVWDGRDKNNRSVSSGIYFLRLESGGQASVRKAMLMK